MAVADINKAEIVKASGRSGNDTGSPEVQVALLTARINESRPTPRTTTAGAGCSRWSTSASGCWGT